MSELDEMDEMDDFEGMEDEFMDDMHSEVVSAFVKSASKSATKLTALIIENNRHNDKKMTTEDIYQIYTDSFVVAMSAIAQVQVQ